MAFNIGNIAIDEVLYATAQNFEGQLLYTLDQLSSASIEVSAESTDITDKRGNIVRTKYKSKSATLSATNAFLHPNIMNAASGSDIERAGTGTNAKSMPKIEVFDAFTANSEEINMTGATNVEVIGLFGNGANSPRLTMVSTAEGSATYDDTTGTYTYKLYDNKLTLPVGGEDKPIQYLVRYDRQVTSGIILKNDANKFPNAVRLTLYCAYTDPCSDTPKPCYVYAPNFMVDPSITISLDVENQEIDYSGNLNVSYCSTDKVLYYIYFPDEGTTRTVVGE